MYCQCANCLRNGKRDINHNEATTAVKAVSNDSTELYIQCLPRLYIRDGMLLSVLYEGV